MNVSFRVDDWSLDELDIIVVFYTRIELGIIKFDYW